MSKISYAVIALKLSEADSVIRELRANQMAGIADWLEQRKDSFYGRRSEDWKPFMGMTINQLLNARSADYKSETHLIEALDSNFTNINILVKSKIEVFFIDIFALFLQRYKDLASRLDLYLADSNRKCCLVMPYGLTDDSSFIITAYRQVWRAVSGAYLEGLFHPTVLRADDITHLRNYLLTLPRLEDSPIPENVNEMKQRYGQTTQKPNF